MGRCERTRHGRVVEWGCVSMSRLSAFDGHTPRRGAQRFLFSVKSLHAWAQLSFAKLGCRLQRLLVVWLLSCAQDVNVRAGFPRAMPNGRHQHNFAPWPTLPTSHHLPQGSVKPPLRSWGEKRGDTSDRQYGAWIAHLIDGGAGSLVRAVPRCGAVLPTGFRKVDTSEGQPGSHDLLLIWSAAARGRRVVSFCICRRPCGQWDYRSEKS